MLASETLIYHYKTQTNHSSKYLAKSTFQMPFWLVDSLCTAVKKNSDTLPLKPRPCKLITQKWLFKYPHKYSQA